MGGPSRPPIERVRTRGSSARAAAVAAVVVLAGAVAVSLLAKEAPVRDDVALVPAPSADHAVPTFARPAPTPAATSALALLIGGEVRLTKPADADVLTRGLPVEVEGSAPASITTLRALVSMGGTELGRVFLERDGDAFRGRVPLYPAPAPGEAKLHIYDPTNDGTVILAPITLGAAPPVSVWRPAPDSTTNGDEILVSGATLDTVERVRARLLGPDGRLLSQAAIRTERAFGSWRTFELRIRLGRRDGEPRDATLCVTWGAMRCVPNDESIRIPLRLARSE